MLKLGYKASAEQFAPAKLLDFAVLAEKAGSFQVRPIHPFADTPASRVLVRAIRSGRAPLRLTMPP